MEIKFKKISIPYFSNSDILETENSLGIYYKPIEDEDTTIALAEINNLINDGWNIVSTSPLIGSHSTFIIKRNKSNEYVYTSAIEVFLTKK